MKASELRQKNAGELSAIMLEALKEQFVLRMQRATGKLTRPSEMKKVRRKIARIKTVVNEMQSIGSGE